MSSTPAIVSGDGISFVPKYTQTGFNIGSINPMIKAVSMAVCFSPELYREYEKPEITIPAKQSSPKSLGSVGTGLKSNGSIIRKKTAQVRLMIDTIHREDPLCTCCRL